ncbi:MAG TPA: TIGR04282 family arsenosugar biosynthesis glycosyltransferase [Anaeromyxobacteraceae bacterium]|nr:TIGR04282 family arsenosugar biosynthesis glycosyltransferase [Anaeromyxobacteraceae bacterium]
MAKAPIPGFAKTRLIPRLGPEGAAELHALLLERTLRTVATSGFDRIALWCAPDRQAAPFEALGRAFGRVELRDQPEGDLGARMLAAFEHHLAAGGPVVMVGTDCPELAPAHLAGARAALADADAVLLPAEDGGYAAIGLRRVARALFEDVRWGTAEVLATTRERLRRLGWASRELAPLRDVDVPEDLEWLLRGGLLGEAERSRLSRYVTSCRSNAGGDA